ncbi:SH3 domain-containing YSC84-like protein 1 isoform 3-T3 [Hipposideros larvatus]|uniref:SH3 domain-containing YSC84-like protein 1 n=1 Tax=Hipposideros armiger TaxID=186990 RepID=A0A8B7RL63_HIPAR|nr:PREDICTED: SH3 domain-containing YSC84-like protein 1 isoform X1 [Hipposideros armiger]XP_019501819.1 PREDICTED: SH3 domain-containing YSC84-like protein 1 isoform X2 [Hipposideros armiger]
MNNPIPSNLKSEAKKAAKILREFTEITSRNGPDKIIPAHVIAKAKGLAVLSVIKAGFLVTARGGSGIVLARLPDGKWSAPSAIGIAGLGGGFEIGIEVSDLVIILNYDRAVEAFAKGGNLTLGGNFTVAVGPLGRNLEGNVALRSSAAVFTYCKSRGLFAGISLEGSCLIERKETNRKFYCQDIRAYDILFGDIPRPAQAEELYEILDSFTEKYEKEGQRTNVRRAAREQRKEASATELPPKPLSRPQQPSARVQLNSGSQSNKNEYKLYPELSGYHERAGNLNQPIEVTALYSFQGQQPGDLSFQTGDRITVISKTDSHFDWWEGKLRGQTGIFPANYVTMN